MQVVRYTALLTGVFYGIVHRRSLQKVHDEEKRHHAVHEREDLIAQAKVAWKKKQESGKSGGQLFIRSLLLPTQR
jgi:F-type H+-transporting ATP synthase subunit e